MKQRSYALLAAATGTVLALTACSTGGSSGSGGGEPVTDGTFKLALVADPGALNPLMTAASPAHQLARLSYDYLLHPDPDTGVTKPWLAEKWEETTTSASFTIRDGVTCNDGSALTAQTVADNVNFITNAANKSALRGVYAPATATATADPATRTVTVTTPEPSPFLLLNLARIPIMCEAGLKDPTAANKTTFGSGMFQMTEAVANDHYSYVRRDGYNWGPDGTTSDTADYVRRIASEFADRSRSEKSVVIGIGATVADVMTLEKSRDEADRALRVLRSTWNSSGRTVARADDVQINSLLLRLSDALADENETASGPLAVLREYDRSHDINLVDTLRAWLDTFGDIPAAASLVHIHVNTFRYRLKKLAGIAGIDLDDPETRFSLMLQLRLFHPTML